MKEFNIPELQELHDFMKRLDTSDDWMMIHISSLFYEGKADMVINLIGKTDGEKFIKADVAEAVLIAAMLKNDGLKKLITNAAKHFKSYMESLMEDIL